MRQNVALFALGQLLPAPDIPSARSWNYRANSAVPQPHLTGLSESDQTASFL